MCLILMIIIAIPMFLVSIHPDYWGAALIFYGIIIILPHLLKLLAQILMILDQIIANLRHNK